MKDKVVKYLKRCKGSRTPIQVANGSHVNYNTVRRILSQSDEFKKDGKGYVLA